MVSAMPGCDLLFCGGEVIDGSGADRVAADVAVTGDRVTAVGRLDRAGAQRVVDISGKVLCPGFIDVHSHDDRACIDKPDMRAKVSQGVTTVIVGNCGLSLAPLVCDGPPREPLNLLGGVAGFEFADFQGYVAAVEQAQPAVNVAALVGHSTLRIATMADIDRKASAAELDAMAALLEEALDAGAAGLSSGVYYPPGRAADIDELAPLAGLAGARQRVYVTHLRDEYDRIIEAMREAFATAARGRADLVISHFKCAGMQNWGRTEETLGYLDAARKTQPVAIDCYPYSAGSSVLDPELVDGKIKILVTWSRPHPGLGGRYLHEVAGEWGCTQREAAERLAPGGACYFQMREDDVQRVLKHASSMIGSDGLPNDPHPHPRLWGTFPRVLGHYARDENLFSLETAVHKMTGRPAARFRLPQRGLIRPGLFADLTVIDPDRIRDNATYESPCEPATGIDYVVVNGRCVWRDGQATGLRSGRFVSP